MKKIVKFIPLMLVALILPLLWSCKDDKEEPVNSENLPQSAKTFLATYYPGEYVISALKDKNDYDVTLSNGHIIEFNSNGVWEDVSAPYGLTVPTGFYPSAIDTYVAENGNGFGINEISRERHGYDVDLVSGVEYRFDTEGRFIGLD